MKSTKFDFDVNKDNSYSEEYQFNLSELSDIYGGVTVIEMDGLSKDTNGIEIIGTDCIAHTAAKLIYDELEQHVYNGLKLAFYGQNGHYYITVKSRLVEEKREGLIYSYRFFFDVDSDKVVSAMYRVFKTEITLNGTDVSEDSN